MHVCQPQESTQILRMAWYVILAKALQLSIALSCGTRTQLPTYHVCGHQVITDTENY